MDALQILIRAAQSLGLLFSIFFCWGPEDCDALRYRRVGRLGGSVAEGLPLVNKIFGTVGIASGWKTGRSLTPWDGISLSHSPPSDWGTLNRAKRRMYAKNS